MQGFKWEQRRIHSPITVTIAKAQILWFEQNSQNEVTPYNALHSDTDATKPE